MTDFTIVLGNKNYSSWSLRGWLILKLTGVEFDEIVIPLDRPETKPAILAESPSGRVPILKIHQDGTDSVIWDSTAIAETLAERFPDAGLWPADPEARALARSVSAEMHAGFASLRKSLPMDLGKKSTGQGKVLLQVPGVAADIARITAIWQDCRARFGTKGAAGTGAFLFGRPSVADAFYAPVVTRFVTYGVPLEAAAADYRDAVMGWPALQEWYAAAAKEPWIITDP